MPTFSLLRAASAQAHVTCNICMHGVAFLYSFDCYRMCHRSCSANNQHRPATGEINYTYTPQMKVICSSVVSYYILFLLLFAGAPLTPTQIYAFVIFQMQLFIRRCCNVNIDTRLPAFTQQATKQKLSSIRGGFLSTTG